MNTPRRTPKYLIDLGCNSIQLSVLLSVNFEVEIIYHHVYSKYSSFLFFLLKNNRDDDVVRM